MSWTKKEYIEQAFAEIGLGSNSFDIEPNEMQMALNKLDAMMATWNAIGIRLGYPLPSSPSSSNLDDLTEVSDDAHQAIYTNLAISLAPAFGKQVLPDTKISAKQGYNRLINKQSVMQEMQLPNNLPRGAGNKPLRNGFGNYFPRPADVIETGKDGNLEFE